MKTNITFRYATKEDVGKILYFIKQLAIYEKMLDQVVATEEILKEWIFEKKKAEVIFALEDEKEVGFALFFHNFSTFLGRAGIHLEDLYVKPEHRGKGYGKGQKKEMAARIFACARIIAGRFRCVANCCCFICGSI